MRTAFPSMLLIHPVCVLHTLLKRFAKQNPFQSYKTPSHIRLPGELLGQLGSSKSSVLLAAPILAIAEKFVATRHYHHDAIICALTCTRHKAAPRRRIRGAAAETRACA